PEHGGVVLAGGDRNSQSGPHTRQAGGGVGWPAGLLEPAQLETLEAAAHADRLLDGPGAVRVEHQLDAVPGHFARDGDRLDVDLMELHRAVAEGDRGRHRLADLARRVVAEQARVHAQPRLAEAAE